MREVGGYGFDRSTRRWVRRPDFGWHDLGDIPLTDDTPAAGVSWEDAIAWCKWASRKTKRTIRLPTETEWEYASRAGVRGNWVSGDSPKALIDFAWLSSNATNELHKVAQLKPNVWGLYDMQGNESEWCAADLNSRNAPLRGGSYNNSAEECTHSWSHSQLKNSVTHGAFRVVIEVD